VKQKKYKRCIEIQMMYVVIFSSLLYLENKPF